MSATLTDELTPAQKLARIQRVQALANGAVKIPLTCPTCYSTRLNDDGVTVSCDACGRSTTEKTVHTIRRQRINLYIRTGKS